jgi:hypothetical protein
MKGGLRAVGLADFGGRIPDERRRRAATHPDTLILALDLGARSALVHRAGCPDVEAIGIGELVTTRRLIDGLTPSQALALGAAARAVNFRTCAPDPDWRSDHHGAQTPRAR